MKFIFIFLQIFGIQDIKVGDILFQNCNNSEIVEAIEDVTATSDTNRFSHIAIVVSYFDTLKVIESNNNGTQLVDLKEFIFRHKDKSKNPNIAVGRVKKLDDQMIFLVQNYCYLNIGKEYDYEFNLNNDRLYCSELVYNAFKYANNGKEYFKLNKMTFIDPKTSKTHSVFSKYYKEINAEIPEGKLGINPVSISLDDKLDIYYLYNPK